MARGVNKVILVGNIGKDPEVRYSQGGGAIANVTLATSETWRDKNTGENQERTEWHRVVFFGKLGEIVGQYVKKGSKLYVEGSLRTRKWQDQSGQDRYTTEIVANEMQMLDSRGQGGGGNFDAGGFDDYSAPVGGGFGGNQAAAPANYGAGGSNNFGGNNAGGGFNNQRQAPNRPAQPPQQPAGFDQFDDDIPF